jgi:hypothetical protein
MNKEIKNKNEKNRILERQNGVCIICFAPLFLKLSNFQIHHFFTLLHLEEFKVAVCTCCHSIAEKLSISDTIKAIKKAREVGRGENTNPVQKKYNSFMPNTSQFFDISIPALEYLIDKNEIDILYEYIFAYNQVFNSKDTFIQIPFFVYSCPNFRLKRFADKNVFVFGSNDIIKQKDSSFVLINRNILTKLDYKILKSYFTMTIISLTSRYFSYQNKKIEVERFIKDATALLPSNSTISNFKIENIYNYFKQENARLKKTLANLIPVPAKPTLLYSPEGGFFINSKCESILVGSFSSSIDVVYPGYNINSSNYGTKYKQTKDLCSEALYADKFGQNQAKNYFKEIVKNTSYRKIYQNGIWRRDYFDHTKNNIKYPESNKFFIF